MTFADRLEDLVLNEVDEAKNDPERLTSAMERMAHAVGFTVAIMVRGDPKGIDELLAGVEAYAHEIAVAIAPMVANDKELTR